MYDVHVRHGDSWLVYASGLESLEKVWRSLFWVRGSDKSVPDEVVIGEMEGVTGRIPVLSGPDPDLEFFDAVICRGNVWEVLRWLVMFG